MIPNLQTKLKFLEIINEMKYIDRYISMRNSSRRETNAEHTYELVMMVIVFLEDFPELDKERTIYMALLHDIAEIYAGDVDIFDEEGRIGKEKREEEALDKFEKILWKEFFSKYRRLIEEYMAWETKESKFVKQLDKIQPIMHIVLEWWNTWYWVDIEKIKKNKYDRVDDTFWFDQILDHYFKRASQERIDYKKDWN